MTPTATSMISRLLIRSARCPPKSESPINGMNAASPVSPSASGSRVMVYSSYPSETSCMRNAIVNRNVAAMKLRYAGYRSAAYGS
jgi:hypothetical protein